MRKIINCYSYQLNEKYCKSYWSVLEYIVDKYEFFFINVEIVNKALKYIVSTLNEAIILLEINDCKDTLIY